MSNLSMKSTHTVMEILGVLFAFIPNSSFFNLLLYGKNVHNSYNTPFAYKNCALLEIIELICIFIVGMLALSAKKPPMHSQKWSVGPWKCWTEI